MTKKSKKVNTEETDNGMSVTAKYLLAFAGGAAAGVALGMYLNSRQGKDMRKRVTKKVSALEQELEDKVSKAVENFTNELQLDELNGNNSNK